MSEKLILKNLPSDLIKIWSRFNGFISIAWRFKNFPINDFVDRFGKPFVRNWF